MPAGVIERQRDHIFGARRPVPASARGRLPKTRLRHLRAAMELLVGGIRVLPAQTGTIKQSCHESQVR